MSYMIYIFDLVFMYVYSISDVISYHINLFVVHNLEAYMGIPCFFEKPHLQQTHPMLKQSVGGPHSPERVTVRRTYL